MLDDTDFYTLFPQIGPFKIIEYDDCFILYISEGYIGISENYKDSTGKNFWRQLENDILNIHPLKESHFGCVSIEFDTDLDIKMIVNGLKLQNVSSILERYNKWRVSSLKRMSIRILDNHIEGIKAFIRYGDKYGIEKAEEMLYLYKSIRR